MPPLFVYGTFLPEMKHHQALHESRPLGPAWISGKLMDLGDRPCLVPGDNKIAGELWEVHPSQFHTLDALQRYDETNWPGSDYIRIWTKARLAQTGQSIGAEVYLYNRSVEGLEEIENGDYRVYRGWHLQPQGS